MAKSIKPLQITEALVIDKIFIIRGQKVMLDRDLAELYQVETKRLKEAVRRNMGRFPDDFKFEMTQEELENWRTQFATSNSGKMGLRYPPFCFTEQGVAMLSSVLNSETGIQVNIQIIRVFTKNETGNSRSQRHISSTGKERKKAYTTRPGYCSIFSIPQKITLAANSIKNKNRFQASE